MYFQVNSRLMPGARGEAGSPETALRVGMAYVTVTTLAVFAAKESW